MKIIWIRHFLRYFPRIYSGKGLLTDVANRTCQLQMESQFTGNYIPHHSPFQGTVSVIFCDHPFKDGNARFTMLPSKTCMYLNNDVDFEDLMMFNFDNSL